MATTTTGERESGGALVRAQESGLAAVRSAAAFFLLFLLPFLPLGFCILGLPTCWEKAGRGFFRDWKIGVDDECKRSQEVHARTGVGLYRLFAEFW